mmetsp:Transcript_13857/g.22950  ORF Transcript_13857/g.22950 Transcript_13857/m.22950 type:complete len:111 (-) Transcript_13857:206-538(-)
MRQEVLTEDEWKKLKRREDVAFYRQRGQDILQYLIRCMGYEDPTVESMMCNELLAQKVRDLGLLDHVFGLYQGDREINDEKIADYIEALFGFFYRTDQRKIVHLLVKICM